MANWTDSIPNFVPYASQLPVDAYTRVGIMAQGEYEQGLQRAQGYIDSIAGLDIAKSSTRQYVEGKLADMRQTLGKNISGDFRDTRLVNQIGSAVGQLERDPVILNGVTSTAAYRKGLMDIQQAQKDGKGAYGVSNEWYFMDRANKWLNDGDNTTSFSDTYTPKYDIEKDIRDSISSAHMDAAEWQDIPKNEDGSLNTDLLVTKAKKGLLRGKVANIVGSIFAKPEVQRQLAIDGMYTYKDYTPQMLKQEQDASLSYYEQKNKELRNKLSILNTLSKGDQKNITEAILNADNELTDKTNQYNSFIKLLNNNFDAAKIQQYTDNQKERYLDSYSWEDNSAKLEKNPQAEMQLQRMHYQLQASEFQYRMSEDERNYQLKLRDEQRKEMIAQGKLNPDGTTPQGVTYSLPSQNVNELEKKLGSAPYNTETKNIDDQITQLQAEIFSGMSSPSDAPVKYNDMFTKDDNGQWQINYRKYGNWQAIQPYYKAALEEIDRLHQNGNVDNDYVSKVQKLYDLRSLSMARKKAAEDIINDPKYDAYRVQSNAPGNIGGYKLVGAPSDVQAEVEKRFKDLQGQQKNYVGQFNPKNTEDRQRINQIYSQAFADTTENKKLRGRYSDIGDWTKPLKEANLNPNMYQFYRDENGQYFLQITRNEGDKYTKSTPIPVDEKFIDQIKGNVSDPKTDAFNYTFGGFLALNKWRSTTPSLTSPEAENTAIGRRNIGRYSVGFHLQAMDGGYIPYLYIRDRSTGTVLATGKKLRMDAYTNDATISPELRAYAGNVSNIVPESNVMDLLGSINEKYIDLLLGKK